MDSIIIGTAGHIDHGKTSLIKALTGHDTDTLAEEKKRGISINLGFTSFKLPGGRILGIVDVPGHEKFIKNMLAGATGIDVALVVIAANEGIMPQTQEHIDILSYLDIQKSLIVLTKIDMVEEDFKELVKEDIIESLQGSFLEGTKMIEVDSISRKGLDVLAEELEQLTQDVRVRSYAKKPRMNIDRVFSVKGYGTVVTGTLMEGVLNIEDELMVYPAALPTKVRNLQVHDQNVETAYAGQRTAINLSGISVNEVKRGNTAAAPGSVYVTDVIDVKFKIVRNTKFELGKFYKLKLYVGSSEEVARFVPITHKKAKAGDEGYAQILLDHEITVLKGDRFVLRTITPVTTVGGGVIIDPKPVKYKKVTEELIRSVQMKDSASDTEMIEEYIRNNPFTTKEKIFAYLNKEAGEEELRKLEEDDLIISFHNQYLHMENLAHFQHALQTLLKEYHTENSLKKGFPKAELFEKNSLTDKKQHEYLLQHLAETRFIKVEQNLVSLYDFIPRLTADGEKNKEILMKKMVEQGYTIQTGKELTGNQKEQQQVLEFLVDTGLAILCGPYILDRNLYLKAREAAVRLFEEQGVLKLSDFRDALGTSRKNALLILEKFDQEKLTTRRGEDRILNIKKINGGAF